MRVKKGCMPYTVGAHAANPLAVTQFLGRLKFQPLAAKSTTCSEISLAA